MSRRLRHGLAVLALAPLLGCARSLPPPPAPAPAGAQAPACTATPDGAPVSADRGIGGTGAPLVADRGIGGTGGPLLAERGIGGTGIIAAITGFASVCLAGQEVALPAGTPILIGTSPADPSALRVGQIAAVEAAASPAGLVAHRISVVFLVSGPVDARDGTRLDVAGQDVILGSRTAGNRPAVGDWVSVSGFRRPDGSIEATRLDPRTPGPVSVRGPLQRTVTGLRIGRLHIRRAPDLARLAGEDVTVTGTLIGNVLAPLETAPDLLTSPAAFFGPTVGTVFIEAYGYVEGGRLRLGPAAGRVPEIFELRRAGAGFRALDHSPGAPEAAPRPHSFEPAPMPRRDFGRTPDRTFDSRRGDVGPSGGGPAGPTGFRPPGPGPRR